MTSQMDMTQCKGPHDEGIKFRKLELWGKFASLMMWLSERCFSCIKCEDHEPLMLKKMFLWQDLSVSSLAFRVRIEMENAISVLALINRGTKFVPRFALEEVGDWNLCLQTTEHDCLPASGYLLCNNPHE